MATGADSWHSPAPPPTPALFPPGSHTGCSCLRAPPILALPKVRGDGPVLAHRPWSAL